MHIIESDVPNNMMDVIRQRNGLGRMRTVIRGRPVLNVDDVSFRGVDLCDLTIRLRRWAELLQRFKEIRRLVETRLGGAPLRMMEVSSSLKDVDDFVSGVMYNAIVRLAAIGNQ